MNLGVLHETFLHFSRNFEPKKKPNQWVGLFQLFLDRTAIEMKKMYCLHISGRNNWKKDSGHVMSLVREGVTLFGFPFRQCKSFD